MPAKFCAVTFTYRIHASLPDIPEPSKTYNGRAKAVLNPDTGKWELNELQLLDTDQQEILNLIYKKYRDFDPNSASLQAPDFMLPDLRGEVVRLSQFKGKIVLLNVWTTWCPP